MRTMTVRGMSDILQHCRERFTAGKGAQLTITVRGKERRMVIVPEPVFADAAGCAVGVEGVGFYVWDGSPIDEFDLIADGGFDIDTAAVVATVFRNLVNPERESPSGQQNNWQKPKPRKK